MTLRLHVIKVGTDGNSSVVGDWYMKVENAHTPIFIYDGTTMKLLNAGEAKEILSL